MNLIKIQDKKGKQKIKVKKNIKKSYIEFKNSFLYRLIHRSKDYHIIGPESLALNRRYYEKPIEILPYVDNTNFGYTNQVLCQKDLNGMLNLFLPVYTAFKVKSLQQLSLQNLSAKISGVMIITILVKDLPVEIINTLQTQIVIFINKSQGYKLSAKESNSKIIMKYDKKGFICFLIRDIFPASFDEDVFLSPFQILNMLLCITFLSVTILKDSTNNLKNDYRIRFNSMRCATQVPITFSKSVKLGVYSLCERRLSDYSTNVSSYDQIISNFKTFVEGNTSIEKEKKQLKEEEEFKKDMLCLLNKNVINVIKRQGNQIQLGVNSAINSRLEQEEIKIDYFQYSHLIMPFRKDATNSLLTIFIPILMIAVMSIFIYFEESLETKLGSVGSFVLGYIALIPTIKSVLPPSKNLSISQIIVYIEALNSMLCLGNSYVYPKPIKIWKNKLFLFSMAIHIICFGLIITLYLFDRFLWIKSYHTQFSKNQPNPIYSQNLWNNPFVDDYFLEYNEKPAVKQKGLEIIPYFSDKFQA